MTIYDDSIAMLFGLKLETFEKIVHEMEAEDRGFFYFFIGKYMSGLNSIPVKYYQEEFDKSKNILNKYLREYKINRILK